MTRPAVPQVVLVVYLVLMHFPQYPLVFPLLLVLPAVAAVLTLSGTRTPLSMRRLPVLPLLFAAWAVSSLAWTADTRGTLIALAVLLGALVVAVTTAWRLTLDEISRCVVAVVKVIVAVTSLSILVAPGWASEPNPFDMAPGWHGVFEHKNGLGAFLVIAAVSLLALPVRRRAAWLVVVAVLLVGSQSSSALAITLLVAAVVLWVRGRQPLRHPSAHRAYTAASLLLVSAAVALFTAAPDILASALGRNLSLTGRTDIWEAVNRQIGLRPVQGWGWGGVWRESSAPTLEMWRETRFRAFYAHNAYLDVLLQLGVVGLLLLLLALLVALCRLLPRSVDHPASLWGALVVLSLCVYGLSESAPFIFNPGLFLLLLVVCSAAQRDRADRTSLQAGDPVTTASRRDDPVTVDQTRPVLGGRTAERGPRPPGVADRRPHLLAHMRRRSS